MWVQSQTTFASIAKDEEGRPVCRVQKQKIWVEGVSYELQEIYGMEHAAGFRREVFPHAPCIQSHSNPVTRTLVLRAPGSQ